ncbi:MAG TPA: MATE family efflux transporter [Firmicutes bacterium]|jgi:putative MATE family efflux protein|nr:MATE family efflux transporter [Bacillota bacterium]HOQ24955.1 MATE family efflux transporter [Bacillota bacterium]HPT68146.1 MATE family efflux transporter [Bacillota bacterium]
MKDLTNGSEGRLIFTFAIPMLIGNVFQQLYNTVDSIIIGKTVGKNALGAVGASSPIVFLMVASILGLTMGINVLVAQYYGAKDMERVKCTMDTGFIFIFLASLIITAAGIFLAKPILLLLKTPKTILPLAITYLQIILSGTLFTFGYNFVSAILRGLGDAKTPLYFLILATVVNILLDLVFILNFGWGVAGAAWATVIAQGIAFGAVLVYLQKIHPLFDLSVESMKFDWEIFGLSLKIGLPSGVQQTVVAASMMALTRIVNGFGADAVAAFTAAGRLDTFAMMPAMNISMALSSFVGQNLGAGKPERVKKGYVAAILMATGISFATTLVMATMGKELIALFNTDPQVIRIGARYLLIVGSFYAVFSFMFQTTGILRGAGDVFVPMLVTIIAQWAVRIPVASFLSGKLGTDGIWWGIPIGWMVGAALGFIYYLTGRWRRLGLVRPLPLGDEDLL